MVVDSNSPGRWKMCYGPLELDLLVRTLKVGGELREVPPVQFQILAYLLAHAGRPVPSSELCPRSCSGRLAARPDPDPTLASRQPCIWGSETACAGEVRGREHRDRRVQQVRIVDQQLAAHAELDPLG